MDNFDRKAYREKILSLISSEYTWDREERLLTMLVNEAEMRFYAEKRANQNRNDFTEAVMLSSGSIGLVRW